jgi:hypothetical protein
VQSVGLGLSRCAGVLNVGLEVGLGLALRRGRVVFRLLGACGQFGQVFR